MLRRLPRSDLLLAVLAIVFAVVEVALNRSIQPAWAALVVELPAGAALAWRRRAPLVCAGVVAVAFAFEGILQVDLQNPVQPLLVILVTTYSLGRHARLRPALLGLGALLVADVVGTTAEHHAGVGNFLFGAIFGAGTFIVGRIVRANTAQTGAAERRAAAAAAEERARIARELHDVIAHSVSVMVVQAGAAEEILRRDPERAVAPLRAVQETGRQALSEMGRLLGILREHGDEIGLAPQPGLGELDGLLEETRAGGLPVELRVEGDRRPLPPGVELSLYRIVQEALTNVRKHAGRARAAVTVRYGPAEVAVEIDDDGTGAVNGYGGRQGLVGMRERVAVYDGTLEAGPRPEGGFAVRARIPL
jgi:signal transduction histidine kinase